MRLSVHAEDRKGGPRAECSSDSRPCSISFRGNNAWQPYIQEKHGHLLLEPTDKQGHQQPVDVSKRDQDLLTRVARACAINSVLRPRDDDPDPITFQSRPNDRCVICTRGWVGRVAAGAHVITIAPKPYVPISADGHIEMLLVAWRLPHLRAGPFGDNQVGLDYSLLLVAVFATCVDDALTLSRGVIADYKTVNEALPYVRGRIDYARQLKRPLGFSDPRVACSFAELTEDTPQNRLLSTVTKRMLHMATALFQSPEGRSQQPLGDALVKLERAARMLSSVPSHWFSERELSNFATCPTPRYMYYEPALSLAKAILLSSSLEGSGSDAGISFLINMNDVFEEYVRATLREVSADARMTWSRFTIRPLPNTGSAFALNNKGYEPDCVCKCNGQCVVADAKYKRLHLSESGRLLPIREDVFQMLAYMSMLGASAGLLVYAACDPRSYATAAPQSGPSRNPIFLWRAEWDSGAKVYFLCLNLKIMKKARAQLEHAAAHCRAALGLGAGPSHDAACEWCAHG